MAVFVFLSEAAKTWSPTGSEWSVMPEGNDPGSLSSNPPASQGKKVQNLGVVHECFLWEDREEEKKKQGQLISHSFSQGLTYALM